VLGELAEGQSTVVGEHLRQCPACQTKADELESADDSLAHLLREPSAGAVYAAEPQLQAAMGRIRTIAHQTLVAVGGKTDADEPALPERLGPYEILKLLGRGGMGAVYMAQHTRLKRPVALKVLTKDRTADPRAVARFEREMEAVGRLNHPHIVQAHDACEIAGTTVLVMEYVDGLDLAQVAEQVGALRAADACELVRQAALGLQYAHEQGLVHRDVKPSNLMLSREGTVKLLDLGLALLDAGQPQSGERTAAGTALGTADYISPEQVSDCHAVDIRSDIYSLGCTLYKLLTGRAPFVGPQFQTPMSKMMAHVAKSPPPIG
jgi:serine/threonine protein kinase